jgi:hypothetical protein
MGACGSKEEKDKIEKKKEEKYKEQASNTVQKQL